MKCWIENGCIEAKCNHRNVHYECKPLCVQGQVYTQDELEGIVREAFKEGNGCDWFVDIEDEYIAKLKNEGRI